MSTKWKEQASRFLPELTAEIEKADSPYQMWFSILLAFEDAYAESRNESLIRRIYDYAEWCCQQPPGKTAADDLGTCVAVCFYEHIPELSAALNDMPRWFTKTDVITMKGIFSYHVGEEGYQKILKAYDKKKR